MFSLPLRRAPLAIAVSLLAAGTSAQAFVLVPSGTRVVTAQTMPDDYELQNAATLQMQSGAILNGVRMGYTGSGAQVLIDSNTQIATHGLLVNGGSVDVAAATTPGVQTIIRNNGEAADLGDAVRLKNGSIGTFRNVLLESTAGTSYAGLQAETNSAVTVSDGTIRSAGWGVLAGTGATIDLQRVTVEAGANTGVFISAGAQVTASDSSITGPKGVEVRQQNSAFTGHNVTVTGTAGVGVNMVGDASLVLDGGSSVQGSTHGITAALIPGATPGNNTISLTDTSVTGLNGSAIFASSASHTDISVAGSSALHGSDGNLLHVGPGSTANFNVFASNLQGNVVADDRNGANVSLTDRATLTGNLIRVGDVSVGNGATWVLPQSNTIGNLSLSSGTVVLDNGIDKTLTVAGNLSGQGTFAIHTDLGEVHGDLIDVQGTASGQHQLQVRNTGREPDAPGGKLKVVQTAGGPATFSLQGDKVDAGVYEYRLAQQGSDWYLQNTPGDTPVTPVDPSGNTPDTPSSNTPDNTPVITPSAATILGLFIAPATVAYEQMDVLRTRMGELRRQEQGSGAWARGYGSRYRVSGAAGQPFTQDQSGFALGADHELAVSSGKVLVGGSFGYTNAHLNFMPGADGTVESQTIGGYVTWLRNDGYYADAVLQASRFANRGDATMSDGVRTHGNNLNYGVGSSLEFGRYIGVQNNWFVEPYVQLAGLFSSGSSFALDNGMQATNGRSASLQGKIGAAAGKNIELDDGNVIQPYAKLAFIDEFAHSNPAYVNGIAFSNDLSGTRGEFAVGMTAQIKKSFHLYGEYSYAKGQKIEKPWALTGGMRYVW
ncbi:autotransporter outer membrane beta-barrel domain-containing protein [Paraburkholderia sp.]|uniref:autotransporter outer membrane beta-barrel domain-containing protein n=1 Tax=Paraburkholderia sp. TaxID=1926495 RepID=UPI00257A5A84|nr:autotransporter outer membrane beta-barrel domain-containing protein [Paraburkholderia sp.]